MIKSLSLISVLFLTGCQKNISSPKTITSQAIPTSKPVINKAIASLSEALPEPNFLGMCYGKAGTNLVICNPPLAPPPNICTFNPETGAITCAVPNTALTPTNLTIVVQ